MKSSQPIQMEQLFQIMEGRRRFTLGLPVSRKKPFTMTVCTPEGVSMIVSQGIEVVIERGVGESIHYEDTRYARAGARVSSRTEAFGCDVVLYSAIPRPEEISCLKPHSILLTLGCQGNEISRPVQQLLMERHITVIALDRVRDRRGLYPLADILEEASGRASITAATSLLANPATGKGILLGGVAGVNPCEVVILGTGMAALAAARSVIGLGGMVRLFDSDPYCLRTAISELGPAVIGSALHPVVLGHALSSADVIVVTRIARRFRIDESVVEQMKKGVILFDLSARYGISGMFPTLECHEVAEALEQGIAPGSNICFINPVSAVPRTAAMAMTNDIIPIIDRLFGGGQGLVNVLKTDSGLRSSVLFYRGRTVSRELADTLGIKWVDINLLLSFS